MKLFGLLLLLVGIVLGDVFQHKLTWRPSKMQRMMKTGEWAAYR